MWNRPIAPLLVVAFCLLGSPLVRAECEQVPGIATLVSPRTPVAGTSFRVLLAADGDFLGSQAAVTAGDSLQTLVPKAAGGGPPHWQLYDATADRVGRYQFALETNQGRHCIAIDVGKRSKRRRRKAGVWPVERAWNAQVESLYSAWLDHLFAVPEGTAWPALHAVTRDPVRNLLHNHLGLNEDGTDRRRPLKLNPDCADNPYFLRAYFAWKLGLPFAFHHCNRGGRNRPPTCTKVSTSLEGRPGKDPVRDFYLFSRKLKSAIHSGSARTSIDAKATDFYPVPLTAEALRPGTVFADPFGHTLMLVRRIPQTDDQPGLLMAVDAQPDATVTIKRYWRGNFLFETEGITGGPGFKAFRPVTVRRGKARIADNDDLGNSHWGVPFDDAQDGMAQTTFYDALARVANPRPMAPDALFRQLHEALYEQVLTRVTAVDNAEAWKGRHPGKTMAMPKGTAIFQTSGPWEDFSTPSRDMRLLIAMDAVLDFPDRVRRMPDAFLLPEGQTADDLRTTLLAKHREWCKAYRFDYRRSDDSVQSLTLADLFDRVQSLEMGYNPNDCPEIRWGASDGSEESSHCAQRAPRKQRKKMRTYRSWFANRRRPAWD